VKRLLFLSLAIFSVALLAREAAFAQTITGVVTNGTTGKPAAGIEVVLVDPMQGMAELVKTTTDQQGKFSLKAGAAQGPRLVRAARDGVNYFKMATPGTSSVAIEVYEAANKIELIEGTADVIRIQADGSTLQVAELFAVKNASSPPRTQTASPGFEIALPDGAQISGADAQGPNGQPISISPQQLAQKGHYSLPYALKPGETRFQVAYQLPYNGEATFSPTLLHSWSHLVLVLPTSLVWRPKNAALFQHMEEQQGSEGNVQIANNVKPGQDLSFHISGTGSFPTEDAAQPGAAQPGSPNPRDSRPGGGLGPPIDAPDALAKYRWMILAVLAVVLAGAAYISVTRAPKSRADTEPESAAPAPPVPTTAVSTTAPAAPSGNLLLEAMKDELFQLEIERQQGVITEEDYEKQKAALDQTLKRALARTRRDNG
jgi:hypothetical protein